jgi:ABC-type transport system involved in multi-copper enzyme maturation permease subunit
VLFLILGIIGMTQEYRHRTATPTFLTTPRRGQVVVAKLVAYALASALFALLVVTMNYVVVAIHAGARGAAPALDADNLGTLARSGLALIIYAVIGVGIGALLRNQVGAIVGGLVYLFVIEPIIRQIPATSGAYKWMPGGALEALTATFQGPALLEPWQGGLLLLGYGLFAAVLGTFLAVRRDIV